MNRRAFLRTLGLGAAAGALPWWLRSRSATAGPTAIPKRIVFYFCGSGMRGRSSPVAPPGLPAPTETAFDLGPLHQPLVPHKKRLIFFDGLDMLSAYRDNSTAHSPHVAGATHALAATDRFNPTTPGGISIDQLIASKLDDPSKLLLRSLEVVGAGYPPDYHGASAYGPGQLVPQIWDPRTTYARLFPAPGDFARRRSAIDLARADADALAKRLGGEDRKKLAMHQDNLRDLETRLGVARQGPRPDPSMLAPLDPVSFAILASPDDWATRYDLTCDLHSRLIAAAFAADLTRVVTFTVESPQPAEVIGYHIGDYGSIDAHDLEHRVADSGAPQSKDPGAVALVSGMHIDHAVRFARLLDALEAVQEPDGGTLLDHTVVLWCGEIAEDGHDLHDLPWIIAGSGGGYFKTGRYLAYPRGANGEGVPHNDLLVSLANAMGVPITTFGNPACCNGPLARLGGG